MASTTVSSPSEWLRSSRFDLSFIIGVAVAALASGALVVVWPNLFFVVLMLDLWLLGYHHVVSTFTRLAFDSESFREHRFLVLGLPWLVIAATALAAYVVGPWALATTYLYWQWFHYTRQSYGIMRMYSRKVGTLTSADDTVNLWFLYMLPFLGIVFRSFQSPTAFLGLPIKCIPIPSSLLWMTAGGTAITTVWWLAHQLISWRRGTMPNVLVMYLLSHAAVFSVGYLLIDSIDHGWLVINIWHNAQYILIVWLYNTNRFKRGFDPDHPFLSVLSQARPLNAVTYFLTCLFISTIAYQVIIYTTDVSGVEAVVPMALILYQTINFHHYIVDGLIWKVRKKKLQSTMGLTAN